MAITVEKASAALFTGTTVFAVIGFMVSKWGVLKVANDLIGGMMSTHENIIAIQQQMHRMLDLMERDSR